jgi:hypothetical protein
MDFAVFSAFCVLRCGFQACAFMSSAAAEEPVRKSRRLNPPLEEAEAPDVPQAQGQASRTSDARPIAQQRDDEAEAALHTLTDPALEALRQALKSAQNIPTATMEVDSPLPADTRAKPFAANLLDLRISGVGATEATRCGPASQHPPGSFRQHSFVRGARSLQLTECTCFSNPASKQFAGWLGYSLGQPR